LTIGEGGALGADVEIRPVDEGEAFAVAQVHVRADAETYRPIFGAKFRAVTLDESLARWTAALAAGDVFLAAVEDGAILGFAHAHGDWMSALYLLAAHKRRGIGARLLAALCDVVRARGVAEIGFDCVAANADAIAFYETMGARQVGRKWNGEGEGAWEELLFALATDSAAALRRR
jgi:GNAT superfamily N-acetyltransferase